uniref:Uncharacterized protein n=1 Tax=Romanomermis culicivorax TaxID=13658 RepID=A0A915J2E5_ROMCU
MRYNVTLKPGYSQPSVLNTTIELNEKNLLLEMPHVNRTIDARSPFVLNVKPWLKGDTLPCRVEPDFQHFTLYQSHLRHNQN